MKKQQSPAWLKVLPFVAGCMTMGFLGSFLDGTMLALPKLRAIAMCSVAPRPTRSRL